MMNASQSRKDRYYTTSHEWIDFKGTVAFTGICQLKLSGFKEIHQVWFLETSGYLHKGGVIAIIQYNDHKIEAQMPVDGKILQVNDRLLMRNPSLLLIHAEDDGWIAQIIPAQPYDRKGLLLPRQYRMNGKSKYAKS